MMSGLEKQRGGVFNESHSKPEAQQKPVFFLRSRQQICKAPCLRIFGCPKFTQTQEETLQVLEKEGLLQEHDVFVWCVSLSRNHIWLRRPLS